jgi:hypothetical protein
MSELGSMSGYEDDGPWGPQQVVQVRLPGAKRTYAYAVPQDWEPLAVGDWVAVPSNVVSTDGGKAQVAGFGRDGYDGPLKELAGRLEPQDAWKIRMEAVKTRREANEVWRAAVAAGVAGERLDAAVAAGRAALAEVRRKQERHMRYLAAKEAGDAN